MKQIFVLEATGATGKLLVPLFHENEDCQVTAYVRDRKKAESLEGFDGVNLVEGDVLDRKTLTESMRGQDIVVAILSGDLLTYAENLAKALQENQVKQIIWMTGMGIHRSG